VPDHKPPRRAADDRATLLILLQDQLELLVGAVLGADERAASTSSVPSRTTLA
jgi:hypothetical protein